MPAADLRRQLLAEHSQLLGFGCANVRGQGCSDGGSAPLGSESNQLRELGGSQPAEPAPIVNATEGTRRSL